MKVLERPSEDELVVEFNHVDVSFVNALRRILLSEIPTVAIEMVYMWNNTSIIHDEVLAHRLGLIPIRVDARWLTDYNEELARVLADGHDRQSAATDENTLVFRLAVSCNKKDEEKAEKQKKLARAKEAEDGDESDDDLVVPKDTNPDLEEATSSAARLRQKDKAIPERPYTKHVYSGDITWIPQGDQATRWKHASIGPVHDDILIAKLRPGQEIELEAHAIKGIGKDHAKYSPVATASYRLYTHIELVQPVYDELAEELVHVYEPGVFELVTSDEPGTRLKAQVCNPYACTMSRNYMRNPQLANAIKMVRIPDRFIFSIESVGALNPGVLLAEALRVLQGKCRRVQELADETIFQQSGGM